jgi:voltage-gated potassium channel
MNSFFGAIRVAFHQPGTRSYKVTSTGFGILILLSVAVLMLDIAMARDSRELAAISQIDQVILWLFGLEIVLRISSYRPESLDFFKMTATQRVRARILGGLAYCARPLVAIDIMAVLALVPALRGLRALRLLRLVRAHRLFRYSNTLGRIARSFADNRLLFAFAFSMLAVATFVGGITIYLIEVGQNENISSLGDGLWWALVTLTTVGFGDITPNSGVGRLVGGTLMVAGMFTLALFAGVVGHTMLRAVLTIREEQIRMSTHIDHLVICNYDPGAQMLLGQIEVELGEDPIERLIFAEGERPPSVPTSYIWVNGDPTKESELDKIRMVYARSTIIVGSRQVAPQYADAATILTIFTIRSYMRAKPEAEKRRDPLYVIAEILDAENVAHAHTAGADEVIETTRLGFSLLAHAITNPGTAEIMSRVATAGFHNMYVGKAPPEFDAKTFGDLTRLAKEHTQALIIGLRDKKSGEDQLNPPDTLELPADVELIYLARSACLPPVD